MASQEGLTAREPIVDLHGAFIRRVNLRGAVLRQANFSRADASNADFREADFANAKLTGTILIGADLTGAVNLTEDQLREAVIDATTKLPSYIDAQAVVGSKTTTIAD